MNDIFKQVVNQNQRNALREKLRLGLLNRIHSEVHHMSKLSECDKSAIDNLCQKIDARTTPQVGAPTPRNAEVEIGISLNDE